ncbi:MAG: glycosyltransferase [Candidatus Omnitrophica bacterium]|nr:glycosyltransferase [Candidatus Omnitrophota bacterium]
MPQVSVIIPAYRCGRYLGAALASVFAQTYQTLDVIVVDGSPQEHEEILKPYADRIRRIVREPKGVSAARNVGIREARGEFIAFLDGDDTWLPQKLERQMAIFERWPDIAIVFTRIEDIDAQGCAKPAARAVPQGPHPFGDWITECATHDPCVSVGSIHRTLLKNNYIPTSSVLARRDALIDAGLFNEQIPVCEDYDVWLRVTRRHPVAYLNDVTAQYRVREDGLSGSEAVRVFRWKEWNARVLEAQLGTVPNALKPMVTEKLVTRYRDAGWYCLRHGQIRQARQLFGLSLRYRWHQPNALAGFVASTLIPSKVNGS